MLNLVRCTTSEAKARLGGLFCDDELVSGIILHHRSVSFDPATFDKRALDLLIHQDKVIGNLEYFTPEDNDEDPAYSTSSTGQRVKNTEGAKRFKFKFMKGSCFQNELQKLDKSEDYAMLLVLADGTVQGANLKDGKFKGYDCTLFTSVRKVKITSDGGGSTLEVDLTRKAMSYWQGNSAVYSSDEIDFTELKPVAGLNVEYVTAPVNAATTTKVKISNLCSDSVVSGLTITANWKLERDGVKESISGVSEVNGEYTFTHTAINAGEKVRFVISENGYDVYVLDTNYYAGASKEIEVA